MSGLPELHLHLDGSLRASTLNELAARAGLQVPPQLRFHAGMGLDEALSKFAFTLSLLQTPDAVRRVAAEICEDTRADGVDALELRFAPQLHRGAPLEAIVDAALEGVAGRAGLILCVLYGESPELASKLVDVAAARPGVVGVDLAGGPAPFHRFGMQDYAPAFTRARDVGLGRTVHAGEGRPAQELRVAIEQLHAQRIGHGTTLLSAPDVVDLVLERGVTIEACPTSNVHTGVIADVASHPLPQWLELGIKACVCADNSLLSDVTTSQELARLALSPDVRARVVANGHAARFKR